MPNEHALVARACAKHGNHASSLIEILHEVQEAAGHVSDLAASEIAAVLNISRADVHGVRSFYTDFTTHPVTCRIKLCRAEACQAVGSEALADALHAAGIETESVYCLGNCALGPAAMIDGRLIGRASIGRLRSDLELVDA